MGVVLYSNGITEEYKPHELVFTEAEIIRIFPEFKEIKTCRLVSVINTWCIYGANNDPNDFNRLASDIAKEGIYSHVLYVHDSELNPDWNVTDNVLYKDYKEFVMTVKKEIDTTAMNILAELAATQEYEDKVDHLPQLSTLGSTPDKRILFGYNPDEQSKNFYDHEEFYKFSQKVYEYITHNKNKKEPFTIYADKKAVIIIEGQKVKAFLDTLLEKFKSKEDYEICDDITKIMNDWTTIKTKKPRKKSNNTSGDQISELNGK